ncbi:MAG: paraquat-inducible protein A [Pseudomonadota bacterium]
MSNFKAVVSRASSEILGGFLTRLLPHPGFLLPLVLVASGAFAAGLSLPAMQVKRFLFWQDDYSLLHGIEAFWDAGNLVFAGMLALFTVVVPLMKLILLLYGCIAKWAGWRQFKGLISFIHAVGKWSMLDVMVIAILIVSFTSTGLLGAVPRAGAYCFATSVVLTMLATALLAWEPRR